MDRSEVYPLIFVTTFLGIYIILLSSISGAFLINIGNQSGPDISGYIPDGNYNYYTVLEDNTGSGQAGQQYFNVTGHFGLGVTVKWDTASGNHNICLVSHVGDSVVSENFFWLSQSQGFGYNEHHYGISEIMTNYKVNKNLCEWYFKCDGGNFRIQIIPHFGYDVESCLRQENHYSITVSNLKDVTTNTAQSAGNAYNLFIGLLFWNVPYMNPAAVFLLAIPMQICLIYLTVRIILAVIPTYGGLG